MDTQQLVILIARDKLVRNAVFDKDFSDPLVVNRLEMYSSMAHPSVRMSDVLDLVPLMLIRASMKQKANQQHGGADSKFGISNVFNVSKSVILDGLTVTLRSVLDRDFDKNRIDNNLIDGATNRERYLVAYKSTYIKLRQKYPRVADKEIKAKVDKIVTEELKKEEKRKDVLDNKYVLAEVNASSDKQTIHSTDEPVVVRGEVVNNYEEGVKIINSSKPNSTLDAQLSLPLSEAPVGSTGASLITV